MVCGGALGPTLLEIGEPDRFEKYCGVSGENYSRSWVECSQCGTANDIMPSESRDALLNLRGSYYEVDLSGSDVGAKYQLVMGLAPDRSDNWHRVERVCAFLSKWRPASHGGGRVMDVGAGTGVFLSRFLGRAVERWEAVALEPDPMAARHLRGLERFLVREELFTGQSDLVGFDLITLNKVLEHIEYPVEVLRSVARALDSNGVVYVEVPDKLTAKLRPPTDNILGALHFHLYDPRSLANLLARAGFEPIRIERVFEPSGKISVYGFACLPEALSRR